jgi:hypothetical protein
MDERRKRLLRLLLLGFSAAWLAFVPSWFRILDGTWPAWALGAHALALTAAAFVLERRGRASPAAVATLCVIAVAVPAMLLMSLRAASEPYQYVHDSAVQSEEAMRFLLAGKNPYSTSYEDTVMAQVPYWGGKNPALQHYVYFPYSILVPLPLFAGSMAATGWYDHRLFLLLMFGAMLWCAWRAAAPGWRAHLLIAVGLNPAFDVYTIQGSNDAAVVGLLLPAIGLAGSRPLAAAAFVGLACGFKQTAVYFALLFLADVLGRHGARRCLLAALVAGVVGASAVLPFAAWDAQAFYDSTYGYLAGSAKVSYPAVGLSIPAAVERLGLAATAPAWLTAALQLGVVLPVLLALAWSQMRDPGASGLAFRYGGAILLAFVCARYCHTAHVAYASLFFVASWFLPGAEIAKNDAPVVE